jgi:hypothetical protein
MPRQARNVPSFVSTVIRHPLLSGGFWLVASLAFAEDFPTFEYHEIARIGNHMGQTSLVDVDKDGKLDWIVGCSHGDVWWFQYQTPDHWIRHQIGSGVGTEVGGTAFDVDGDGWVDQVSGSTWFRNPGPTARKDWAKFFNGAIDNSHDVVAADIDGDGKLDVVMIPVVLVGEPAVRRRSGSHLRPHARFPHRGARPSWIRTLADGRRACQPLA